MTAPSDTVPQQATPTNKETTGFGVLTLEKSAELAAISVAAAARAEVESAYVMAIRNPRNEEDARVKVVAACRSPLFAAKARYRKPQGGNYVEGRWVTDYVVGPSIRFAEEMLRCWKNVLTQQTAIYDDATKRIVRITTRDLEANTAYSKEITLEKSVERKSNKDREVLGQRMNTRQQIVYIVKATEDELANKEAALASKVIRNNGLRLIPQHIIDEAMAEVERMIKEKINKDPGSERRAILDGFSKRGVMPTDLERHLGCPSAQFTDDNLVTLRDMLNSIEDGHATWAEYLEGTTAGATDEIKDKSQPETKGAQVAEQLKEVVNERGAEPVQQVASQAAQDQTAPPAPQETSAPPQTAQEQTQATDQASAPIIQAIKAAELVLAATAPGQKKHNTVLNLLKVRLTGKQVPLDVIPPEQRTFYLAQLNRAVEALKTSK